MMVFGGTAMTFEGIETRNSSPSHARDRLMLVSAPVLLAGWAALCIWCLLSLGALTALSAAPTEVTGRATRPDAGLIFISIGRGERPCP